MEQTECSETSAYKIQMPGNYPEESINQTLLPIVGCSQGFHSKALWSKSFLPYTKGILYGRLQ